MTIGRLVAHKNGEGRTVWMMGLRMEVKLLASETGGALSVADFESPANDEGPPPHAHHGEDEIFYIIDGAMRVRIGDREFDAPAGSLVLAPRA